MLNLRHIVIADFDSDSRGALLQYLEKNGFRATSVPDARGLDRLLARQHVDLVVLDARLPGEDGLTLCRRLSAEARVPVIMLAARGDDVDRIIGLEIGADDYLTKPFNPRELVARARNVLRRWEFAPRERVPRTVSRYRFASWTLDTTTRELTDAEGARQRLTGAEYRMLLAFVSHPRRVLSRHQLIQLTKGHYADPYDRSIDVRVSRLRQILRDNAREPAIIKTVYGDGYVLGTNVEAD
jgi:two-component system OmpR family response regulator